MTGAVSRLLLVLGGARSGKSAYAERRLLDATGDGARVVYVATLHAGDDPEVDARIAAHRARRPRAWDLVEAGADGDVAGAVARAGRCDAVLVDGLELGLALAAPADDAAAAAWAGEVVDACRGMARSLVVLVSSEVGLGLHPVSAEGLAFRDRCGALNQAAAARCDEAVLVVAGLPLALGPPPR